MSKYHKHGPGKGRRALGNPFHKDMLNQAAKVEDDGVTYITREIQAKERYDRKHKKSEQKTRAQAKNKGAGLPRKKREQS
jgi:hypothetical protein